ncbi:MAG: hypothetical protein V5A55_03350 [Halovenus sp.]
MADSDRLVVLTAILPLLGIPYVTALQAFARDFLLPLTAGYLLVALALFLRVARADLAG